MDLYHELPSNESHPNLVMYTTLIEGLCNGKVREELDARSNSTYGRNYFKVETTSISMLFRHLETVMKLVNTPYSLGSHSSKPKNN